MTYYALKHPLASSMEEVQNYPDNFTHGYRDIKAVWALLGFHRFQ